MMKNVILVKSFYLSSLLYFTDLKRRRGKTTFPKKVVPVVPVGWCKRDTQPSPNLLLALPIILYTARPLLNERIKINKKNISKKNRM